MEQEKGTKSNYSRVEELWREFMSFPFPKELHDSKYDDIDTEGTDTFVAGCISSYLGNNGELEEWKQDILREFVHNYPNYESRLSGEGKRHFDLLNEMSTLILETKQGQVSI